MNILVVDVGGTHVKVCTSAGPETRKVDSGRSMTAARMADAVKRVTADWTYDAVSLGYPGPVLHGKPVHDPINLGPGWVGFDYAAAFGRPTLLINDAAMQALGSYTGGRMLFLGLGTGLGSAMIVDGNVEPMELGHLPYKRKGSYEDYVGLRGLERLGKKAWRREVAEVVEQLRAALEPEYIVLGGGNARLLKELPPGTRLGDNANACVGGVRLWQTSAPRPRSAGRVSVVEDHQALWAAAAELVVERTTAAVSARGRCSLVLSGGSTPLGLYALLATSQMPWSSTHVFWGDERHVPPDHPDSNFRGADAALLSKVPIPASNVHRIRAELDAGAAAREYEAEIRSVFALGEDELPRFDVVLLGLGPDGHTASLFPGTRALHVDQHLVVANWVGKLDSQRITLTAGVLNNAACIIVLATGEDKGAAAKAVLQGAYEPEQLPAQLLGPTQGELVWLLDRPAGSRLDNG